MDGVGRGGGGNLKGGHLPLSMFGWCNALLNLPITVRVHVHVAMD